MSTVAKETSTNVTELSPTCTAYAMGEAHAAMGSALTTAGTKDDPRLGLGAFRLRQYLRWGVFLNFALVLLFFALQLVAPFSPAVVVAAAINMATGVRAIRLAGTGRSRAAVAWYGAGLWILAAVFILAGPAFFALLVMLSILPAVVAMPYVSRAGLRRMIAVGIAIVVVGAGFQLVNDPRFATSLPETWLRPVLGVGVTVLATAFGLSLWHMRVTLGEAISAVEHANAGLRRSEALLETKVRERIARLEQSRRGLVAARDEALAANRHKSAFLANMSHELRTPLNAIIGFSEVLSEGIFGRLTAKQSEYVGDVYDSSKQLLADINDILDLSKVEAGHLELKPTRISIESVVEQAVAEFRDRPQGRDIEFLVEVDEAVGDVEGDERRIVQILRSLLSNAVRFTGDGGTIKVRAGTTADAVVISVSDLTIGIEEADRERIFEPFWHSGTEYARRREGSGLGLALAKRFVELHRGRIWVESAVGGGSTFRFTLPTDADRGPGSGEESRRA